MEPGIQKQIDDLTKEYGVVPPPWVQSDDHPYSIGWRMGRGEAYMMLWWDWWEQQRFTEEQRIAYFRKYPPPHRWLAFLIMAIWDVGFCRRRIGRSHDLLQPYQ